MSFPRQVLRGVASLFRSKRSDDDVADEVSHYLDEAAAAQRARGLSADAAHRAARLEVGSPVAVREEVRASGWEHAIETTLQDARHALRRLGRSPVYTATASLTLAIGIGATTAVFSVVHPILLEPLPFPDADRIVTVDDWNSQGLPMPATLGTFDEVRARARSFDRLAATDPWKPSLTGTSTPERVTGQRVTADYFNVFGAIPIAGRGFTADDDQPGAPNLAIISSGLAQRRFGAARAAVGQAIDVDGDPWVVIGVMPQSYANLIAPSAEIWAPLRERSSSSDLSGRVWGHHYQVVGRLAGAVTIEGATRELRAIGEAPVAEYARPRWATIQGGLLVRPLQESVTTGVRPALYALVAAVTLLLLLTTVNVANLLLARSAQRRAEVAMRLALGAGRGRIVRQLLTESVMLAVLGGILGLGVAQLGLRALVAVSPPGLPRVEAIRLSAPVFAFAAVLTTVLGVLVGWGPALGALRSGSTDGLQRGSHRTTRGGGRTRSALVIAEVGLALVLLVSVGLLLRSVRDLLSVAPGFDPSRLLTLQVVEAGHAFDSDVARLQFYQRALDAVRAVPGVREAAFTSQLPLSGEVDGYGYESSSRPAVKPGEDGSALRYAVTSDYFTAMRIPLVAGRRLAVTDGVGAPLAVVINESMARRLFESASPIGQRMRFGPQVGGDHPWMEVVGVVGDVKQYSLAAQAPDAFYVAAGQWDWVDNVATLVVRTTTAESSLIPGIKAAIWSVNPNVPIERVRAMSSFVAASAGTRAFVLFAIGALAITALLLATVGLYGVVSGTVTERVREIGIRTALGASPGNVVGEVVGQALTLTAAGVVIGLAGGYAASRLIASMLFGVSALDPVTYLGGTLLMVTVALVAAWAPARRAVGLDPTMALRAE